MALAEHLHKTMTLPFLTTVMWPGTGVKKSILTLSRGYSMELQS